MLPINDVTHPIEELPRSSTVVDDEDDDVHDTNSSVKVPPSLSEKFSGNVVADMDRDDRDRNSICKHHIHDR
jgi:hypothetical protein